MDEQDRQLEALETRIRDARAHAAGEAPSSENEGLRAGIELVGSIAGGGGLGYALDAFFDTKPLLLVIFLCLGVVAGFLSVWKITQGIGTGVGFAPLRKQEKNVKQLPEQDVRGGP